MGSRQLRGRGLRASSEPVPVQERLVAAALVRDGRTHSGGFKSHWEIRAALGDEDPTRRRPADLEGFLTSTGRFVDRDQAKHVGILSGQLSHHWKGVSRELLSSDVF